MLPYKYKLRHGFSPDDTDEQVFSGLFSDFCDGDYSSCIPLGFVCVSMRRLSHAYTIWNLALMRGQKEARPLIDELMRIMSSEQIRAGEEDLHQLIDRVNKAHFN